MKKKEKYFIKYLRRARLAAGSCWMRAASFSESPRASRRGSCSEYVITGSGRERRKCFTKPVATCEKKIEDNMEEERKEKRRKRRYL